MREGGRSQSPTMRTRRVAAEYLRDSRVEQAIASAIDRVLEQRPSEDVLGALARELRRWHASHVLPRLPAFESPSDEHPTSTAVASNGMADATAPEPNGTARAMSPDVKFYRIERGAQRKRVAYRIPRNSTTPHTIDNENFVGQVIALHRPTADVGSHHADPYAWHFEGKARIWEFRLQGRLKTIPKGRCFVGITFEEFDYSVLPNAPARLMASAGLPLLRRAVGQEIAFSWGSRENAAQADDPEKMRIVCEWTGWDQVIVTPAGQAPPALSSDITSLGLRRNMDISSEKYRELVAEIMGSLDTESTYTFCFWGASRFADLINWNLKSLLPLGKTVSLSTVLGNYVPHLVLYGLDDRDSESDRHVASRKTRYFEMMMWSTLVEGEVKPGLDELYDFHEGHT